MIHNIKKRSFLFLFIVLFIFSNFITSSASYIIDTTPKKEKLGPGENVILRLGVTGDSYGGFLIDEITEEYDLDLQNYCLAQSTVTQNKNRITECIYDRYKYIVISIGVNDHIMQTDLNEFLYNFIYFAELAQLLDKQIILHTYMNYQFNEFYTKNYKCQDYDNILQYIANLYPCVHYIDMHDINGPMYYKVDGIHYNYKYYEVLVDRIKLMLNFLNE